MTTIPLIIPHQVGIISPPPPPPFLLTVLAHIRGEENTTNNYNCDFNNLLPAVEINFCAVFFTHSLQIVYSLQYVVISGIHLMDASHLKAFFNQQTDARPTAPLISEFITIVHPSPLLLHVVLPRSTICGLSWFPNTYQSKMP